jgi:hypothetical protein
MKEPIALNAKIYVTIQGFLATNFITRFIYRRITQKDNPTTNDLLDFWVNYPDQEHSGAAGWRKFFCMKPNE